MKYEKIDLGNVKGENGINGQDGVSIDEIRKTGSFNNEDYYEIVYTDPNKPVTEITITNAEEITIDEELSTSSTNPPMNKTVTNKLTEYYTKEMVDNAREIPVFLHFCGPNYDRPWYNKDHPYAEMFKEYAERADYGEVVEYLDELPLRSKIFGQI